MYTLRELASKAKQPPASVVAPRIVVQPTPPSYDIDDALSRDDGLRDKGLMLPVVGLMDMLKWLLVRWKWIVAATMIGALLGIGFGMTATPRYTVYTDLLVPPSNLQLLPSDVYGQGMQADSQILDIESKLRVLTSRNVLLRVVKDLDLQNDPEFVPPPAKFSLSALFGKPASGGDITLSAMRSLGDRIVAGRQERSYLVTIGVWTADPDKSVKVADALAQSFQEEISQADSDSAGRAAKALSDRLAGLQEAATQAEEKVAEFRRERGLQTSGGELISALSMSQISGKLVDAKARQAEARSRYAELTGAGSDATAPSSSLQSPTLTSLRGQYATLKQRYDALAMTYGPRYPELINTRTQLAGLEQQITLETGRIMRAAKVDLDQATAVVEALNAQASTARSALSLDNDAQVKLNDLERDMAAKVSIYQTFLTRSAETTQRQQLDTTNIRVISTAIPPLRRSWPPRTMLLAAGGAFGGCVLGIGLAFMAGYLGEWRRNRLRMA